MTEYVIRKGEPGDVPFLVSSWTKSYSASLRPSERGADYWPAQKEVIATLLDAERARVYVAVVPGREKDREIAGWVCGERGTPTLLHYVYVKQGDRHQGIAKALVQRLCGKEPPGKRGLVVTHVTTADISKYAAARGWGTAYRLPWIRVVVARKGKAA